ncbi:MAG TPA: PA14 domain-containing protein [Oligoflexus sp.]|uniref:PA14 domain-containing protein n=1 Tax=Oligoflexus sp. TaxID=1971216 RepID=UPI002D5A4BC7|nr:PA14 domain-containing protein [Oligoflexus sp.]HYX34736.1 PA14 domain-containing protein [Oligoflexus sp.]
MLKKATALLLAALASGCGDRKENAKDESVTLGETPRDQPTGVNDDKASIGAYSDSEMEQKIASGLAIWRQQRKDINGVDKGACANCHSSDGLELGLYDISDETILRRAHNDGVNDVDAQALVEYFAALRQKYKITSLKSVLNDRPLQPQGEVLAGATKAERDLAFAVTSLRSVAPTLFDTQITTVDQALKAKAELTASKPLTMKIGIPFPRISEDCFRGEEHCTANDWISDLPRRPKPEMEAEWFKINDRYRADPTDSNLREVLKAVESMTVAWKNPGETNQGPAGSLGTTKFKALQITQHLLRRQQLGLFDTAKHENPILALEGPGQSQPNAAFFVADFAFDKTNTVWTRADQMPAFVRQSFGETAERPFTNAGVQDQKNQIVQPWWYFGFNGDSSLSSGTRTEYFFGSLGREPTGGYPLHRFYLIGKRATTGYDRTSDPSKMEANNIALSKTGWKDVGDEDLPRLYASVEARQLYRKLEVNWTAMWMLLMKEQIEKSGLSSLDKNFDINVHLCAPNGFNSLRSWVTSASAFDGQRAAFLFNLYNKLNELAGCGLEPLAATYAAGEGTGLTIDWYSGTGDEWNGKSASLLNSKKVATRVEPIVYFPGREDGNGYFSAWAKSAGIDINGAFSSRGTGTILAPVTGDYSFLLNDRGGGGGKIIVAGKEVYNRFRYNDSSPLKVTVSLQAGQTYPIIFERHGYAAGGIQIEWQSVNGKLPRQKIPTSQLYP